MLIQSLLFLRFPFFFLSFFPVLTEKVKKLAFMQLQMILTNKGCAEHPFGGRNTQHMTLEKISLHIFYKTAYWLMLDLLHTKILVEFNLE